MAFARFQLPGNIFAQDVKFKVHGIAGLQVLDIGMPVSIGYDGDGKGIVADIKYGEADAVEADGAFFHDERSKFRLEADAVQPAAVLFSDGFAGAGTVHMALHDMAVYTAIEIGRASCRERV